MIAMVKPLNEGDESEGCTMGTDPLKNRFGQAALTDGDILKQ